MTRRAVPPAVAIDVGPAPPATTAHKRSPSAQPGPRRALLSKPFGERPGPNVARGESPEHRPRHLRGDSVEARQQPRDSGALAVGLAADVTRQRRRHASTARTMDQDPHGCAIEACGGLSVEEVKPGEVEISLGTPCTLAQHLGKRGLGRLAFGDFALAFFVEC